MKSDGVIEPVRRSFAVLEALSRRRTSTLGVLTGETGLPRPTVVRLLHTLIVLGYAIALVRNYSDALARRCFRYSILYLTLLFAALAVLTFNPQHAALRKGS